MSRISIIKELFKKYSNLYQFEEGPSQYLIDEEDFQNSLIEFAKLHVKAAIREITKAQYDRATDKDIDYLTNDNLKNFYPLTNIK